MNNESDNPQETNPIEGHFEIAPIESITKAEIDCQIATARQFPRSLAQFYKRAEAMVTVDQETAESCIYRLRRKDKDSPGGYKIIEGESVRLAEIVAANFGNLRSAVHIVGHTPTRVSVRAVCHDLETNNLIAVEKQAKTAYKDGSPYNEDMAITTANALVSKALRDAIFRVVPKALVKPLKEKAKLVAFGDGQAFIARRKKALEWATKVRNVPIERVFNALEVKGEEDMTVEHLEILTGLKNAIMDGDQSVDEAFPPLESESKPVLLHPEKAKQEQAKAAKTEAKAAKEETKATVVETKKPEPETKAPPTETAKEDEKAEAAMALAPEQPKEVVKEPEPKKAEPAAETPAPAQPEPGPLTGPHAELKAVIEGAGFSFQDLIAWGAGKFLPAKNNPMCPKDWGQIDNDRVVLLVKSSKGIIAALRDIAKKKQGGPVK